MLSAGQPGIVIVGYTNKAVNNVKKKLPVKMAMQCMTIHKLLEFEPVYEDYIDGETGRQKTKMTFEPAKNALNKLPHISTLISEESSMIGTDLWAQLVAALPSPNATQLIMLGDLNQLPPVFGPSILGFKLLELRTVELTHVYRQALESPIISLATAVRTNCTMGGKLEDLSRIPFKLTEPVTVDKGEKGKVTIHPWKKRVDWESALQMMHKFLPGLIDSGAYNPDEDMILCPFNKSFGTIELKTGSGTGGRASFLLFPDQFYFGIAETAVEFRFQIPVLAVGTDYVLYLGFLDNYNNSSDITDGAYLLYDGPASANWITKTANNSTRTATTSSTAVTTSWMKAKILVNAAGTLVTYYINGTSIGTVSTNIPTSSARTCGLGMKIQKVAGTGNRAVLVDYASLTITGLNR